MDRRYLLFGLAAIGCCLGCLSMYVARRLHEPKWSGQRFSNFVEAETLETFLAIGLFGLSFLALLEMIFDPAAVLVISIALLMVCEASIIYQLEVHRAKRRRETQKALDQLAQQLADRLEVDIDRSITRGLKVTLMETTDFIF